MQTLDQRLDNLIAEKIKKYKLNQELIDKEKLKNGITVGYSREHTFEKAEEIIEKRLLACVQNK